ncbi:chemotaxis protein CheA [Marinicrinis sediminis]|uniref:Chemotaxis protein CheA n=1 Tax=Marinicrinis sediminis TaxID=1652465 RepID=A0ABW5RAE9_9BACL
MSFDMAELKHMFLEEFDEQLQLMDEQVLSLERGEEPGEAVRTLFRAAHTVKGSSAVMGYEEIKELTHTMEHVLDKVRSNQLTVTDSLTNLLFECTDGLHTLKKQVEQGVEEYLSIAQLVSKLQSFIQPASSAQEPTSPSSSVQSSDPVRKGADEDVADSMESIGGSGTAYHRGLSLDEQLKIQEYEQRGWHVYVIELHVKSDCLMKEARMQIIYNEMAASGEWVLTHPAMDELLTMEESVGNELVGLYACEGTAASIQTKLQTMTDVDTVKVNRVEGIELGSIERKEAASKETSSASISGSAGGMSVHKKQTIRVDVDRLENLMNLVGELVIDQTRLQQVEHTLNQRYRNDDSIVQLEQISDHFSRVIEDLQDQVTKVRMLPIDQLFNRFPRMIRDLSKKLDKEVEVVLLGGETELDRTVIEEISDPLIHLIRNALDHGLELPAQRVAAGKSAQGRLTIRASQEENQVVIVVEDDGKGIDPDRIRQSAVQKGVISEQEAEGLSERESIQLIFRPGFSTSAELSDVSGRGVGMDIVKSHIEKLNGIIDIASTVGQGTKFKIKLPLTLAIIPGLMVKLVDRKYVVPMNHVMESVRVAADEIQWLQGQPVIHIREEIYPLISLHQHFGIDEPVQTKTHKSIVILGMAEKRVALVVDELIGNQDIVVKSLGRYVGDVPCISGATILGDGQVALILEVSGIFKI